MTWKLAIAGCGNVGTALLELLNDKRDYLKNNYGFECEVCLVTDPLRGCALDSSGIPLDKLLGCIKSSGSFNGMGEGIGSFESMLSKSGANIFADATPTNLTTGEPGLTHLRVALSRGVHSTTTSKGPLAVAAKELECLAKRNGAIFRYEGSVMSGTPLLSFIKEGLAGCNVSRIEGILNGTTNYMITRMEEGLSYDEALKEAQAAGYAEADPTADVEGFDAAVKVSILAYIMSGEEYPVSKVDRTGIAKITPQIIKEAAARGKKIKLMSILDISTPTLTAKVAPEEIPLTHPLASITGGTNAASIYTDNLGVVTVTGPGAGRKETGQALLTDILAITRSL